MPIPIRNRSDENDEDRRSSSLAGLNAAFFALMFAAAASIGLPVARAATAPKTVAAFCRANPNLDFPDRAFYGSPHRDGIVPREVAAVGATNWRCRDGKVYVCAGGAAGSACAKMDPNREPSEDIRQTCEANPGQHFFATAVIGNSSSTWRCQGSIAKIIATVPLDSRGFMQQTWAPLFDARGKINTDVELGADPR
jgi:hypothetical protein